MYTTEELINICRNSVVSYKKWNNRDSYLAQVNINDIHLLLNINIPYTLSIEDKTIWLRFELNQEYKNLILNTFGFQLNIDSREEYFEDFGYDNEMFDSQGMDLNGTFISGYLPTPERLEEANGEDWY